MTRNDVDKRRLIKRFYVINGTAQAGRPGYKLNGACGIYFFGGRRPDPGTGQVEARTQGYLDQLVFCHSGHLKLPFKNYIIIGYSDNFKYL